MQIYTQMCANKLLTKLPQDHKQTLHSKNLPGH